MKIDISHFNYDIGDAMYPEYDIYIPTLTLTFLTGLLQQHLIEATSLHSMEPEWLYGFTTTTNSTITGFGVSDSPRINREYKIKSYTIFLPKNGFTGQNEYKMTNYVTFCFKGVETVIKKEFKIDISASLKPLKSYALQVIEDKLKTVTPETEDKFTEEEEKRWLNIIKKYISGYTPAGNL